ncbi:MAG: menaquinone biosynthesis decarboxylase [Bacteroidetes bacterium]|nr:MAG: menaquinone biosynthesis decarboxylase [Bacteroidota bacterium]
MAFKSLSSFVDFLEKNGELVRIAAEVSSNLEISEINDRFIKHGGKALLFENIKGSEFPVLVNAMGSKKRIEMAFQVNDIEDVANNIHALFESLTSPKESLMDKLKMLPKLKEISSWTPNRTKKAGKCQEIEMKEVNLKKLPILKTWPHDGGPFITFPVVHSLSPENGNHNMGMYRLQILDKETTGMHWHMHKGGASHYRGYKEKGEKMPVTVTLGGDPVYTYAATAPLPEEIDEYMLAGFLRKEAVKLVKCKTNDIYIPEDVDFVLEGYVDPSEELILEGPFGDHTGYYSLADMYPSFHITHISHKKGAIFPATVVGIPPQEDVFMGLATERIFLAPIKMTMVPEIKDMHMPMEGVFHNIVLNSIQKTYPGQSMKVMSALWGAGQMMFNKYLAIFDENINLTDYSAVVESIAKNVNPLKDILLSRGPMDVLDHASERFAEGGKMGIDATRKNTEQSALPKVNIEEILAFDEVLDINSMFIEKGQGILIIKLKKVIDVARLIARKLFEQNLIDNIKFVVFIEEVAEIGNLGDIVWRVANNSDPNRDCFYTYDNNGKAYNTLFIDGLRKNLEMDNFNRDWPNIVCMDEATIKLVDEKWSSYNIGEFLPSPSLKYRKQLYEGDAIAK